MMRVLLIVALCGAACTPDLVDTRKKLPDGGYACWYVPGAISS